MVLVSAINQNGTNSKPCTSLQIPVNINVVSDEPYWDLQAIQTIYYLQVSDGNETISSSAQAHAAVKYYYRAE